MSFDGLPVPVIDHTGAGDGAPDAVLQRLAPIGFGREICGDLAAAERREWWIGNGKRRLRRGHDRAEPDPALSRPLGRAGRPAARPLVWCWPRPTPNWSSAIGGSRCSPIAGQAASWRRRAISGSKTSTSTAPSRCGGLRSATSASSNGSGWSRGRTRLTSPGVSWRRAAAPTRFSRWRSSPTGATITARPGCRALPPRSPPKATSSPCACKTALRCGSRRRAARSSSQRAWIENFDLPIERERGLSDRDHNLCIGRAEFTLGDGAWHGLVASLDRDASPDIGAALARRRAHDAAVLERALGADPLFDNAPGWVHAARPGRRSLCHRAAGSRGSGRAIGDRGLSVVRRLGAGHDDRPGGLVSRHRPLRRCPQDPRNLRALCRPGHAAECFPRRRGGPGIQHGRCRALVHRGVARLRRDHRRYRGAGARLPGPRRHRRVAPARHAVRHRRRSGRRIAARRRARCAIDLDGCAGRRSGGDAAHRQAGRDQCAVAQRAGGDGRFCRATRRAGDTLSRSGRAGADGFPALHQAGSPGSLRRDRRPRRRRRDAAAQSAARGQPAGLAARCATCSAGCSTNAARRC